MSENRGAGTWIHSVWLQSLDDPRTLGCLCSMLSTQSKREGRSRGGGHGWCRDQVDPIAIQGEVKVGLDKADLRQREPLGIEYWMYFGHGVKENLRWPAWGLGRWWSFTLACKQNASWFLYFHFCILDIYKYLPWDSQKSPACPLVSCSPPSSRSPYGLYLCVHTVLATCWFSGEQLFHSWESLQVGLPRAWLCYSHTWVVVFLCRVYCGFSSFCIHHWSEVWMNPVLKIQTFSKNSFSTFPFHHKHCSWVFSLSFCSLSDPLPRYHNLSCLLD